MSEEDIVKRCLVAWKDERMSTGALYKEAADEIERLRECLKETRAAANRFLAELGRSKEEWERTSDIRSPVGWGDHLK